MVSYQNILYLDPVKTLEPPGILDDDSINIPFSHVVIILRCFTVGVDRILIAVMDFLLAILCVPSG